MSQLSFTDTDPIARTLGLSDREANDSVGSDSFLLKVGAEEEDLDDDEETSEDSCDQVGAIPPVESRRSKKRKTCHVMFGIFTAIVVVFVIVAISVALVFTLRDHKDSPSSSGESLVDSGVKGQTTVSGADSENGSTTGRALLREEILINLGNQRESGSCADPLRVKGYLVDGAYSFLGIRYAQPPISSLRWKPSLPWSPDTQDCVDSSPVGSGIINQSSQDLGKQQQQQQVPEPVPSCIQIKDGVEQGSEDCLYINVWTPTVNFSAGLNVLVYIHGGGLMTGSGLDIDPALISSLVKERNVVVVTFNYRLNAFGFLSLSILSSFGSETGFTSGNYGIMDQVLALKWVQGYIWHFGGDPNKVTLMGQGSGATSIYALLASKSGHGLFSKAWLASLSPRLDITREEAEIQNLDFLNRTACRSMTPPSSQYNCLMDLSATSVLNALPWKQWLNDHFYEMPQLNERTVGLAIVDDYLLSSSAIDAIKEKQFNDVPLLIGSTAQETDLKSTTEHQMAAWQYSDYLRQILKPFDYVDVADVLQLYPPPTLSSTGASNAAKAPESVEEAISTVVSDIRVVCPTDEVAKVAANMTRFSVYRYIASYMPSGGVSNQQDSSDKKIDEDRTRFVEKNEDKLSQNDELNRNRDDEPSQNKQDILVDRNDQKKESETSDIKTDLSDDDAVMLDSDLTSKEDTDRPAVASHNCAYSGIDVDAFFGVDRRRQPNGVSSNSFHTFSKLMRDKVFEFVETGQVKSWRTFPDASYDISDEVRETEVRFKSEKCNYWRTNSFYPQYTWMN